MEAGAAPWTKDGFSSVFEGTPEDEEFSGGKTLCIASDKQEPDKKRGTLIRKGTGRHFRVGKSTFFTEGSSVQEAEKSSLSTVPVLDEEEVVEQAKATKTRGGGLPAFKACQVKLARTWDSLQRRMARRSAAVHKHNVADEPRLLAAAQDMPPEAWQQDVERWPEVAKDSARLRSVSPDSASRDNPSATMLSTSLMEASSSVMVGGASLLLSTTISDDGLKTPPYARSPVPAEPEDELEQASILLMSRELSDTDAEERRTEILRAKARKRLFAPPPMPPPPVRDQVIGKLLYLHTCREVMGESRYGFERRRLELQSDVKGLSKYTAREAAPSTSEQDDEQQQRRPALRAVPEREAVSQLLGSNRTFSRQQSAEEVAPLTSARHESAMAAFEYQRLCREHKVTMPILGSFAVHTHEEPTPLCADNWSLGDAPLVALAKSPWRKALAAAGHCRLRGNRLTNEGVAAVVESLGPEIATLDLTDNLFDAQGAKVLVDFVHRGALQLRELDVSRNRLDDRFVASLCQELLHECHSITQLGLAEVQMGAGLHSGPALGMLVQGSDSLAALNVSYNMLQGEAAYALMGGVYENGTNGNGVLRHLDLSWNCLGQGPMCKRVAQKLGAVLHDGRTLLHLDVSFNKFGKEECAILAKDVHDNHTLWGLHMDGNSAIVDADGFIRILDDMEPECCFQGAPAPLFQGKQGKKKKKAKPKPKKKKKKKGALGQEEAWRAWLQRDVAEASALRDFGQWQIWNNKQEKKRDAERAAFKLGAFQGLFLPEELCENPGLDDSRKPGTDAGLHTRVMPPRLQEDWLQTLSCDIREELRAGWTFGNNNAEGNLGGLAPVRRCRSPPTRERSSSPVGEPGSGISRRDPGGTEGQPQFCVAPSCWLCNGWVEVPLQLTPGISSSEALATASLVCAFVSLDNFARPIILKQGSDGRFEGSRFMPPVDEPMLVVFQVDDHLEVANDLPQQKLATVLRIALYGQESNKEIPFAPGALESEQESESAAPVVAEIQEANMIFVAQLAEQRLKQLADHAEPQLLSGVPEELRLSKAPPRRGLPAACTSTLKAAPQWTLCTSVWALHPDIYSDKMSATLTKCFEKDWQMVKAKLSNKRSISDIDSVRAVLQKFYPSLQRAFQKLSTVDRNDKEPGITLGVFSNTLSDSKLLFAHPQYNANYFDSVFAASNFVPKELAQKATVRCSDGLVRWQFMEMLVRLGEACRISDAKKAAAAANATGNRQLISGSAGFETTSQAVARVVSMYYGPMSLRDEEEVKKFRKALFVERMDKTFKRHMVELKATYEFFTDSGRLAGKQRTHAPVDLGKRRMSVRAPPRRVFDNRNTMSRVEWQVYLEELNIIDTSFPIKLVPYAFAVGAALNPNAASSSKHLELSFVEFLVSLGYVIWVRAGCVGGAALEDAAEMVFTEKMTELYAQVLAWMNSPLLAKLRQQTAGNTPILRKLGVSVQWLHKMQSLLAHVFSVSDDNLDGLLSFKELSNGFARKDTQQELVNIGLEPAHIEEFYKVLDIECDSSVTMAEAVLAMARVKDRLKRVEPVLAFLRGLFNRHLAGADPTNPLQAGSLTAGRQVSGSDSDSGMPRQVSGSSARTSLVEVQAPEPVFDDEDEVVFDAERPVFLSTFKAAAADPKVQARMCKLGMPFGLMDLWEYLESERCCFDVPGTLVRVRTEGRAVRLGAILTGYLNFSDPLTTTSKASSILRQIFLDYDDDGSGSISRNEWLALLGNKSLLKKMQRTGLLEGFGYHEQALEESLSMLFHKMDQDSSGSLTIDEVIAGFLEQWHLVKQRKLEEMQKTPEKQPVKPSEPAPGAKTPRNRPGRLSGK